MLSVPFKYPLYIAFHKSLFTYQPTESNHAEGSPTEKPIRKVYNTTCIQKPLKGSNQFKCRFYSVDLRRVVVSEQWSLNTGGL